MEEKIIAGIRTLYSTTKECPNVIRFRIKLKDKVDPEIFHSAVETTMKRYPYFLVELKNKGGQYYYVENPRPVVISDSLHGVNLNSTESNYHMVAFSWQDNWMSLDIFHGLTDGTGAYEVVRTLLYYYCLERYGEELTKDGIRLVGDSITSEEWIDPVEAAQVPNSPEQKAAQAPNSSEQKAAQAPNNTEQKAAQVPNNTEQKAEIPQALNLVKAAGLMDDTKRTVYSIAISETDFMNFNKTNDGSPGTMVSLLFSRAIAKSHPESSKPVRIAFCVNQRNALKATLAHQSLVGGAILEYKEQMKNWPLHKQAAVYRGMVFVQTQKEKILADVNNTKRLAQMIMSLETDQERLDTIDYINAKADHVISAVVSYVGKADFKEAEKHIQDFRTWTKGPGNVVCVEISAVNGRFVLDVIQPFSSPVYVNSFLEELEENGINYELQDVQELDLPDVKLPWNK